MRSSIIGRGERVPNATVLETFVRLVVDVARTLEWSACHAQDENNRRITRGAICDPGLGITRDHTSDFTPSTSV